MKKQKKKFLTRHITVSGRKIEVKQTNLIFIYLFIIFSLYKLYKQRTTVEFWMLLFGTSWDSFHYIEMDPEYSMVDIYICIHTHMYLQGVIEC